MLPLYFWNPGYAQVQEVREQDNKWKMTPCKALKVSETEISPVLAGYVEGKDSGVFVIEGLLNTFKPAFSFELRNIYFRLKDDPREL